MCWASQVAQLVKNSPANAGDARDVGSIPGSGRSPGEGHGNPLQYSCLETPMERGGWQATVHWVAESDMTEHARSSSSRLMCMRVTGPIFHRVSGGNGVQILICLTPRPSPSSPGSSLAWDIWNRVTNHASLPGTEGLPRTWELSC